MAEGNTKNHRPITIVVIAVIFAGVFLFYYLHLKAKKASWPPELQSAAAIESMIQSLPEAPFSPGAVRVPILVYHSVRPVNSADSTFLKEFEISPELFEQELKYLRDNGYTTITPDQLVSFIQDGTTFPAAKPVLLNFDDGWQNQYKYAFPLLKKYHAVATFYVYTNPIGKKHFLTWDELKEMDSAGMTIADHTLSHPYLKGLSLEEVSKEVTESKKILEDRLGKPVVHFASPFGYISPEIQIVLKAAGYATARTAYKGASNGKEDLLKLRAFLADGSFSDFVYVLTKAK